DVLGKGQIVHDIGQGTAYVTALVHAADQELGYGPLVIIQIDRVELVDQVLVEGDAGGIGNASFLIVRGIVVCLHPIVRDLVITEVFIDIYLIGVYGLGVRIVVVGVPVVVIHKFTFLFPALQGRVLLQLLLQALLKSLGGQLYELHELDLLGRQFLGKFKL